MLLPRPDPDRQDELDEEDPREALVRRLLEHQKFKAAAELLHERETLRSAQYSRPRSARSPDRRATRQSRSSRSISSACIGAFRAVLERAKRAAEACCCPPEQMSIEQRIEQLLERLSETEACRVRGSLRRRQTRAPR